MTSLRQAAQQALEALESDPDEMVDRGDGHWDFKHDLAITALRAALAEPEQEPVAWMDIDDNGQRLTVRQWSDGNKDEVPLYTAPTPRRPLHDMAVFDLADTHLYEGGKNYGVLAFARAIERAHGIGEQHEP